MFSGGNQYALLHQTGGVADPRDVSADGFDFKTVQINAVKHDAGPRGRRQNSQVDGSAAVQTYPGAFHRPTNCLLVFQLSVLLSVVR